MRLKWLSLVLIVLIASFSIAAIVPMTSGQEFPHVAATKSVTPSRIEAGATVQVTIQLRGVGGMIPTPVDIVLIIDRSGSMEGKKLLDAKVAAKAFLNYTDEKDRVGLVSFGTTVELLSNLTSMTAANKESFKSSIDSIKAVGATDIYDAIIMAQNMLLEAPRINAPPVIVLLTDGMHNWPSPLADSAFQDLANQAKEKDVIIYTVGLGSDVNPDRLRLIATTTEGEYYFAATSDQLKGIYQTIGSKLSFAGTNIEITETIPSYLAYNGDASEEPSETSSGDEMVLVWRLGHLRVGEEWQVTYTAQAEKAVEADSTVVQCKVEYMTSEAASAVLNLTPGIIFHDIAITELAVTPDSVQKGALVTFEIGIKNMGITRDSFELRTSFDGSSLDSRTVALDPEESATISFSWNTSDVEGGEYIVTVKADPDENVWEVDEGNNVATSSVEVIVSTGVAVILVIIFVIIMTTAVAGVAYAKFRVGTSEHVCAVDHASLRYSGRTGQWYCPRCGRVYESS